MGNVGHARMHQEMTRDRKLPVSAVPHGNVRGAMLASQAAHAHGQLKPRHPSPLNGPAVLRRHLHGGPAVLPHLMHNISALLHLLLHGSQAKIILKPLRRRTKKDLWATPRSSMATAAQIMTTRTSTTSTYLPTQVRNELHTPNAERGCTKQPMKQGLVCGRNLRN